MPLSRVLLCTLHYTLRTPVGVQSAGAATHLPTYMRRAAACTPSAPGRAPNTVSTLRLTLQHWVDFPTSKQVQGTCHQALLVCSDQLGYQGQPCMALLAAQYTVAAVLALPARMAHS